MDGWKKVYTGQNVADTGLIQSLLEQHQIQCRLRNFYTSAVVGDLPFVDNYPEVWVPMGQAALATSLIEQSARINTSVHPWTCRSCQEENPSSFELCWNCQDPKLV